MSCVWACAGDRVIAQRQAHRHSIVMHAHTYNMHHTHTLASLSPPPSHPMNFPSLPSAVSLLTARDAILRPVPRMETRNSPRRSRSQTEPVHRRTPSALAPWPRFEEGLASLKLMLDNQGEVAGWCQVEMVRGEGDAAAVPGPVDTLHKVHVLPHVSCRAPVRPGHVCGHHGELRLPCCSRRERGASANHCSPLRSAARCHRMAS